MQVWKKLKFDMIFDSLLAKKKKKKSMPLWYVELILLESIA